MMKCIWRSERFLVIHVARLENMATQETKTIRSDLRAAWRFHILQQFDCEGIPLKGVVGCCLRVYEQV